VIVEDNPDVRAALRQLLELGGHTVAEAADGHSAIETIARVRPDVAFVDIGLPVIDGLGVARALRARTETQTLFLVALSGYGANKDRRIGLRAGFDDYLVKPVDPASLDAVLRKASARSSGTRPDSTVVPFRR
jgi:CheY-like chemotaxis protein